MRGSLWSALVVAVGSALFLGAGWKAAAPSSPTGGTSGVVSLLGALSAFAGNYLLLVAVGTFVVLFMGRFAFGSTGGL
jgi:hypothetical protein